MVYTLTVTYMCPLYIFDWFRKIKLMQNIWFDTFTKVNPILKTAVVPFQKRKHTFCTGEKIHIIRFWSTLDAQIGVLTEKSRFLISMEMVLLNRDQRNNI